MKELRKILNDIPKALLFEEKKGNSNINWNITSTNLNNYHFCNVNNVNNFGSFGTSIGSTLTSNINKELVIDIDIKLSDNFEYNGIFLTIQEKYNGNIYVSTSSDITEFFNIDHTQSEELNEFGKLLYNKYVEDNLNTKKLTLKKFIKEISPTYDRERKINDILNED